MLKILKALIVAALICATPAFSLITVYQSTPDLTKPANGAGICSSCGGPGVGDQFVGSLFTLSSATKIVGVEFAAGNAIGYWPVPVTVEIYKTNALTVGDQVFTHTYSTYDSVQLTGYNNSIAIADISFSPIALDDGQYLIFFYGHYLSLPTYQQDYTTQIINGSGVLNAHSSLTGDRITEASFAIGYKLFAPGGSLAALTGVPEPANWALLIGGFGLAGVAARRRRVASVSN